MAGMNAPKPSASRARRGGQGETIIHADPGVQPELPEDIDWPSATQRWWAKLGTSALLDNLTDLDWEYLLDTAMIHADFHSGNFDRAGELRLRIERFGTTPAARASLRIQIAEADKAETRSGKTETPQKNRHADLRAVAPVIQMKQA